MSRRILGLGFLLATMTAVAPALAGEPYEACTKTVASSDSNSAHEKYIAGKQDYDEGNYESAIRRFRDAYKIDCTKHELLIIISAAYERHGDRKEAITALETYVARAPNAPDVSTYQAKIENLKKQVAAAQPAPSPTTAPPAKTEVREHSPWPWVVVGVGGAALVAGVIVLVTSPDLPAGCDEDTKVCTRNPSESASDFSDRQSDAGRSQNQPLYGIGFIAGGAAVAAGGLLWHFLEPTGPKEARAKLRPSVSPSFAGLTLGGSF